MISLSVDPGKVQSRKVASPMRMALISRNAAQKKSSKPLKGERRIQKRNVKKKAIFTFTLKENMTCSSFRLIFFLRVEGVVNSHDKMPVPIAFASLVPDLVSIPYSLAFRPTRA